MKNNIFQEIHEIITSPQNILYSLVFTNFELMPIFLHRTFIRITSSLLIYGMLLKARKCKLHSIKNSFRKNFNSFKKNFHRIMWNDLTHMRI